MFFQTWNDFFNMGGYGFYVWLAYSISFIAIIALAVQSVKQRKTVLRNVLREAQREARLQQAHRSNKETTL
ncbi:heme exporter protein CcmD [Rodentibacter myodis]|uniref:Heme exporter protein D n=1 Tax=Rodentibacter myodis TaxID=1907939 RepID=A0A1V3JS94_9PAST|nr:heme exporter protein CcmD [Rodentibacter myodis]OOF59674.1 heme exporter protein CcmD [Rodentibacter myodis]